MLVKPLEVGKKIDMSDFDPNSSKGFDGGNGEALEELAN